MLGKTYLWVGVGTGCCAYMIYFITLTPGLSFIDSGELAAVCATLGIAHPTGYPLYTLLGWLVTQIKVDVRPIYLLNCLSAVFSSITLFVFFLFLNNIFLKTRTLYSPQLKRSSEITSLLSLGCGTLLLAFCKVFWSVALITEVYALHALFISLLMLMSIKAFGPETGNENHRFLWIMVLFFSLGLSFCNHMSTALIIPALLYFMFAQKSLWKPDGKKILLICVFFIMALFLYIYLPIRASQAPTLNWGNPQTWKTFFWHISGKQYQVWMFSSFDTALKQMEYFIQLVLGSFGFIPVILIPFGIWYLFHTNKSACWFLVILFLTNVVYAINYDINDIDAYFLPAFMVCGVGCGGALIFSVSLFYAKKSVIYKAAVGVLCSFPLIPLYYNYSEIDQSKNNHAEQYVENILRSVKQDALILSYQWDYFCSPLYYLQLVETVRVDVTMIEVKLLKRSWYLTQLQKNYPILMKKSQHELELFSRELYKFENGQPYDPEKIQGCYIDMINSFIQHNIAKRPVYITCEQGKEIGPEFQRVPEGLVFRLYPLTKGYVPFDISQLNLPVEDDFKKQDRYHLVLKSFYAFMLSSRGIYEMKFGNRNMSEKLIKKALDIYPDYPLAKKGLAALKKIS